MIKEPASLKETNSLREALETIYPGAVVNCGHPATGWLQHITFPVGNTGKRVVVGPEIDGLWHAFVVERDGAKRALVTHEKASFGAVLYRALSAVMTVAAEAEAKDITNTVASAS